MKQTVALLIILFCIGNLAYPQFDTDIVQYTGPYIGYNFFIGEDAPDFMTTPEVFGSGVMDFSGNYTLFPFWLSNPKKNFLGVCLPAGLLILKYRFVENRYFNLVNDTIDIQIDNDPDHDYSNSLVSYDGSKLVTGYLHLPITFYLPVSKWFGKELNSFGIFGSVYYDRYLFTYHKLRYSSTGDKVKEKTRNTTFREFGLSKNKFGVSAGVRVKRIGISAMYMLTPFFENEIGVKLNEMRVGICIYGKNPVPVLPKKQIKNV